LKRINASVLAVLAGLLTGAAGCRWIFKPSYPANKVAECLVQLCAKERITVQARRQDDNTQDQVSRDCDGRVPDHRSGKRNAEEDGIEPEIFADRFADAENRVRPQRKGDLIFLRFHHFTPYLKLVPLPQQEPCHLGK